MVSGDSLTPLIDPIRDICTRQAKALLSLVALEIATRRSVHASASPTSSDATQRTSRLPILIEGPPASGKTRLLHRGSTGLRRTPSCLRESSLKLADFLPPYNLTMVAHQLNGRPRQTLGGMKPCVSCWPGLLRRPIETAWSRSLKRRPYR
jgi:hypothetical protein